MSIATNASVALGLIAAALWFLSATVQIPFGGGRPTFGNRHGHSLTETTETRRRLNAYAAIAAGLAAGAQAIATMLSH